MLPYSVSLCIINVKARLTEPCGGKGAAGGHVLPQFLAYHLTPISTRGQIMPAILLRAPLGFSDLPTALKSITTQVCKAASARDNDYGEN